MNKIKQISLCTVGILPLGKAEAQQTDARQQERPNVVFIFTDDHAANAVSAYNKTLIRTPNMDRMAEAGMVFDNCFATNSISTPSRATILTGKYSHLNGTPVFNEFDGNQQTFPKLLQQAGYTTGMIGKWHLTSDPTGFDYWEIFPGQGLYYNPIMYTEDGGTRYKGGYATNLVADKTIEFIERAPKDKPFFVMSQHKAPHRPFQPRPEFAGKNTRIVLFPLPGDPSGTIRLRVKPL